MNVSMHVKFDAPMTESSFVDLGHKVEVPGVDKRSTNATPMRQATCMRLKCIVTACDLSCICYLSMGLHHALLETTLISVSRIQQ